MKCDKCGGEKFAFTSSYCKCNPFESKPRKKWEYVVEWLDIDIGRVRRFTILL